MHSKTFPEELEYGFVPALRANALSPDEIGHSYRWFMHSPVISHQDGVIGPLQHGHVRGTVT